MTSAAPAAGVYVHFPWCVRKCPYCDFNSHPLRGSLDASGYLNALLADLEEAMADVERASVGSVFCGGGTPSLFPPDVFATLLEQLAPWLRDDVEVTLEANPGTVEHCDFGGYRRAGINRLSLGAQSFDAGMLARLGRIHGPDDTLRAFHEARAGGIDNINLDLMYGLPEQSPAQALDDLHRALALEPEHLSWYQLTIEPRTEFARRPPVLPDEEPIAAIEAAGHGALAAAGLERYEISAFARPGRRCRHNLNYWHYGDYVGVGAGAHGKRTRRHRGGLEILRTTKASQPRLYLADPTATRTVEVAPDERSFEFLMNALRLVDGVDRATFEAATGLSVSALESAWGRLTAEGLVEAERLAATPLGLRYLDGVLQRFLR